MAKWEWDLPYKQKVGIACENLPVARQKAPSAVLEPMIQRSGLVDRRVRELRAEKTVKVRSKVHVVRGRATCSGNRDERCCGSHATTATNVSPGCFHLRADRSAASSCQFFDAKHCDVITMTRGTRATRSSGALSALPTLRLASNERNLSLIHI